MLTSSFASAYFFLISAHWLPKPSWDAWNYHTQSVKVHLGTPEATHHKVGILSSGHLMVKHTRVGRANVGLETAIQQSDLAPVLVQRLYVVVADTSSEVSLLERHAHCTHGRLRGQTRHA
jgi:hypothetical protein